MNLHFTWGGGGDLGEKISDITNTGTKVAKRTSGGGGACYFGFTMMSDTEIARGVER